jgi:hypothetical protein
VLGKRFLFKLLFVFAFYSWCKILRVEKLQQIVVVVVNGITDDRLKDTEQLEEWKQLFTSVREYRNTKEK